MGFGVMTWVKSSLHHLSPMPQIVTYCRVMAGFCGGEMVTVIVPGTPGVLVRLRDTRVADRDHRNAGREVVRVGVELRRIARQVLHLDRVDAACRQRPWSGVREADHPAAVRQRTGWASTSASLPRPRPIHRRAPCRTTGTSAGSGRRCRGRPRRSGSRERSRLPRGCRLGRWAKARIGTRWCRRSGCRAVIDG